MYEELFKRVECIIKENMIAEEDISIKPEDEFFGNLGFDSVKFMGLFYSLEDEFDISIINSAENYLFYSIVTVNDLIDVLQTVIPNYKIS